MGIPITTNVYEELLNLSREDKIKVIAWIAETMLEKEELHEAVSLVEEPKTNWPPENLKVKDDLSEKTSWYVDVKEPNSSLTSEEWENRVNAAAGLWSDLPDDFGDDIVYARTTSNREINLDD